MEKSTEMPRAKVTHEVNGWPVGFVGYYEVIPYDGRGKLWNHDFTDFRYHTVDASCIYTDEPVTINELESEET